jgi:hypothetical protein
MNIVEMYVLSRGLLPAATAAPAVSMLIKIHAYFARSITNTWRQKETR